MKKDNAFHIFLNSLRAYSKSTCCFPSIGVKNVKVIVFIPSLRFSEANCSDVGHGTRTIFLAALVSTNSFLSWFESILTSSEAILTSELLTLDESNCVDFWDVDFRRENGQSLQCPLGEAVALDGSPETFFSTRSMHILTFGFVVMNEANPWNGWTRHVKSIVFRDFKTKPT